MTASRIIDDHYELNNIGSNTHAQIDTGITKLAGIETGATKYPDTGEQAFLDADHTKLDGIETGAQLTNSTRVNNAGAVMETDYHANTILRATIASTPSAMTVLEDRIVGRLSGGSINDLPKSDVLTIINVDEGADVTGSNPPQAHTADKHTNRTRTIFKAAPYFTDGTPGEFGIFFPDGSDSHADYGIKVPEDFVSVTQLRIIWRINYTGTNHLARMYIGTKYGALGQTHNNHQEDSGLIGLPLNGLVNGILYSMTDADIDLADLAKNDYLHVEVWRDGDGVGDDWVNDIIIIGIELEYIADQ